jgi:alpha-glucosidase
VRKTMLDVLRFWMRRGADGIRIDVAHMLMKDPELRDNPPAPDGHTNPYDLQHPDFHSQLHVYDRRHPDTHVVLSEIRSVLEEFGERLAVGEIEAMGWGDWAEYFGSQLEGLHLPFAFKLIETPWEASALEETIAGLEASLPAGAWPILALGNHDRPRLASRIGRAQARVAAMLLLTLRGTPMFLYGDELGLVDQPVPRERQRDYFGLTGRGVSRDPTRTPMPWNAGPNGGFAPADAPDLWLPVSSEYETVNVESQLHDPGSSLNLYRRLIALRKQSPALRGGDYGSLEVANGCLVYERRSADDRKLVALNLSSERAQVDIRDRGSIRASTHADREGDLIRRAIELRHDEGVVLDLDAGVRA